MTRRNTRPTGLRAPILLVIALGLCHELAAQSAGQARSSASLPAQSQAGDAQGAAQGQPAPAASQSQTAPLDPAQPPEGAAPVQSAPTTQAKQPKNDRIFFALPNYLTVEKAVSLPPLSTREKFKTVAEGCFDPVEVAFIGVEAGIGQADNTNPTYGQGFKGYSKRFGTAYADAIIGNFGTGAIFPSLLRQDPRYYQLGKGSVLHRIVYAAGRIIITRSETSGKVEFNFSEFLGNGLAAGAANAYHPGPHTLVSNADVLGTQVLLDLAGYELKEFWPDLRRLLVRLRHGK